MMGLRFMALRSTGFLLVGTLLLAAGSQAAEPVLPLPLREAIIRAAAESGEKTWRAANRTPPTVGVRELFAAALALCATDTHPERLDRLLDLAIEMQDRDPQSRTRGNFRWYWRNEKPEDLNAVDFCMQHAAVIWIEYQSKLPATTRAKLQGLLESAIPALLSHRVPETYTNIALMNAGDLIMVGEALDRPEVAAEGYARLDRFLLAMWESGTHEYCSPTYHGTDLDDLILIEAYAGRETARAQARALLEFFWTDIALNWFPAAQKLGGAHSRDYDYLSGLGVLDQHLMANGWLPTDKRHRITNILTAYARWRPPAELKTMSETRLPRLVDQVWGFEPAESRTHYLCHDVTLSAAGAGFGGWMDLPLCADLPGPREGVRCYFIPDGRHDPYGKTKIAAGAHEKTHHLQPFWAAAQLRTDALGVAVYRDGDLPAGLQTLESHFVMPMAVDGFWIGDRRLDPPKDAAWDYPLKSGEPLVLRKGTAAVGVRLPWARGLDGREPTANFVFDGNTFGAVRLTVAHKAAAEPAAAGAGAAFWVRIGSGLADDAAFENWRREFAEAKATADVDGERVRVTVAGADGPVVVGADGKKSVAFALQPPPSRPLLAVDGDDIGSRLIENLEPIRDWRQKTTVQKPVKVPASKKRRVFWEAEAGRVIPPMGRGDDPKASGDAFVWMPAKPGESIGSSIGSTTWNLELAAAGRYFVWARVQAPTPENDSFIVRVFGDDDEIVGKTNWLTGVHKEWQWIPLVLGGGRGPTPLELPAGTVSLQIRVREGGTRLDRLFLTADPKDRPR